MADRPRNKKGQFITNNGAWFRNAAKSLGYAGLDLLNETMPAVMETIDVNKEFVVNVGDSLKQLKNKKGDKFSIKNYLTGKALQNWIDGEEYVSNLKADLKSGKFYNPDRLNELADADFGLDDFDFGDDDFSFDLDDDLDDANFDSETKVVVPNVNITSNINKDNPMVKAVQQQTKMMADAEMNNIKRDITIAESQMSLSKELTGVLYGGLNTINTNLSSLITFNNEHTSGYIGASLKYYEENIKYLSEISSTLRHMAGLEKPETNYKQSTLDSITTATGGLNLEGYKDLVKKQFRGYVDNDMMLSMIATMLESDDGIKALAMSPLKAIPKMVVEKMIPGFLTETLKEFDNTFKEFIPALLNKMGSWAEDAEFDPLSQLKAIVGSIFGINNRAKTRLDPSNYEKGVIPFDGITRKSIVEVIPGYLSKILSALTGKDEMIYDSQAGKFVTRSSLDTEYNDKIRSAAMSGYDAGDELVNRVHAFGLTSKEEAKMQRYVKDVLVNLSMQKGFFNPYEKDFEDNLANLLPDDEEAQNSKELIRSLILSLDKHQIENLAGAGHIRARENITRVLEELEASGNMIGTAQVNGLYGKYGNDSDYLKNSPLLKGEDRNTKAGRNFAGSIFTPTDRFNKNSLDYLRDIYRTLLEGVAVFWTKRPGNDRLADMSQYEKEHDKTVNKQQVDAGLTDSQKEANTRRGLPSYETIKNIPDLNTEGYNAIIQQYITDRDGNRRPDQKVGHFTRLVKMIFGTKESKQEATSDFLKDMQNLVRDFFGAVDEGMYKIIFGENSVGYTDDKIGLIGSLKANFKVWLFGDKNDKGESIGGIINKFNNYLNEKIYTPIKDAFIGKDGIITKFKQSEMYKKLIERAKNVRDKLFGTAGPNGVRSGGKFSEFANNTISYFRGTRLEDIRYNASAGYYVNSRTNEAITDPKLIEQLQNYSKDFKWDENVKAGKRIDDGVFGNLKSIGLGFKENLKEWLFGSDVDKTKNEAKGLLSDVGHYFKEGLQGFTDLLFGQHFDKDKNAAVSNKTVDNLVDEIKAKSPKALASGIVGGGIGLLAGAGGFGLLGSLFLGPMSGVIIGTATGFLSQSDKFKSWLFGKDDPKTGEHIEGFISKSTQEFFKNHKGAMIGGAALGMLKGITGIGILPSFILGGPLTGALFGLGTSLLTRSEAFQNMIFGKDNGDGSHTDGLVNKVTNKLNNDSIKKKLGFGAAGAGLGAILGSSLSTFGILGSIAFGPLSGALLGAAAGITMAASKWSDTIFGSFDKDGNRKEQSVLTKMMNAVTLNILEPAKIQVTEWSYNVQDWFAEHIAEPFIDSVEPLKEEVRRLKDRIVGFATAVLDKLHITDLFENIADGVKTGFNKVLKFVGDVGKGAFNAITKFTGFVLSSPVKLVHLITDKILMPKHMREGIDKVRDKIIDNIKSSKFVQGVNDKFLEPLKGTIIDIADFTKDKIKKLFGGLWKGIKLLGKGLIGAVSLPFKGIGFITKGIKSLLNKADGVRDEDRLNNIMSEDGKNRGFLRSVGDLLSTYNPFSSLRSAAKHSSDGAGYQDDRVAAREQRKAEREAKRKEHQERIKELREQLDGRKERAKAFGYNNDGSESDIDVDKILDKDLKRKYGKDYKNMSAKDKDQFKETKAVNKTIFNIGDFLRDILAILQGKGGGVKVDNTEETNDNSNSTDNNKSNNESATPNINPDGTVKNNTDEGSDNTNSPNNKEPDKRKSKKEREAEREAERERLKDKSIFRSTKRWFKNKVNKYHTLGETEDEDKDERKEDQPSVSDILHGTSNNTTDSENNTIVPYGGTNNGEFKRTIINEYTTGETEYEDKKERKEEEFKNKQLSILEKMTTSVEVGNKDRKEHSSLWSSIFSKKGLITGALILLIPLLMNFIKKLPQSVKDLFANLFGGNGNSNNEHGDDYDPKEGESPGSIIVNKAKEILGLQDTNGDRTDATNDIQVNSDAIEAATVGGIRVGASVINAGKTVVNTTKSVIGTTKAVTSLIKGNTGKYENTSVKSIAKTLTGKGNDVTDYKAKYLADDDSLSIIKKFANFLDEAVEVIAKAFKKRFKNLANNTVVNTIGKAIKTVLKTPSKLLNWVDDIAKGFGKAAAVMTSGHTLDLVLGGYGAISGFTASETANLFNVSQKDINPTMRAASSILKGILNLGWGWAIQLVSDISVAFGGPDIVKILATLLYTLLSGADADKASTLLKAQQDFDTDYAEYVKTQEYLKGNGELAIGTDGKTEIIINDTSKIKESKDSYNDRTNESLGSKILGGLGSVLSGTKKFFVGQIGNVEEYEKTEQQLSQLEDLYKANAIDKDTYKTTKKDLEDALKKYETKNGLFKNNTKNIKSTTTTSNNTSFGALAGTYKSYSNTATTAKVGGVGGSIDELTTGVDLTSKSANAVSYNGINTKINSTTKDTTTSNDIMSPLLSSFSSYKDIVQNLQKYIKNTVTNTVNKLLKSDINSSADGVTSSDQLGSIKKIIFYGSKALTMPIYVPFKAAKLAFDKMDAMIKGMNDIPSFITKATNVSSLTKYNYWTNGKPAGTGIAASFKKIIFQISRTLLSPLFFLDETLGDVSNKVNKTTSASKSSGNNTGSRTTYAYPTSIGGSAPGIGGAEEYDMLNSYKVSSYYGWRDVDGDGVKTLHRGIDLYKGKNTPIYSFTDGIVDSVTSGYAPDSGYYNEKNPNTDGGGFGNWVRVKDSAGAYHIYAHMNGVNVSEGQRVNRGDQLGIEGHTGSSTGAHLHYEVRNGGTSGTYHTDPSAYLKNYVAGAMNDSSSGALPNVNDSIFTDVSNSTSTSSKPTGLYGLVSAFSDTLNSFISPFSEFTSTLSNELYKLLGMNTETVIDSSDDNSNGEIYYDDSSSSDDTSSNNYSDTVPATTMSKSPIASSIYNFFKAKGLPDVSIAAILANLNAESALRTNNLEDQFNNSFGMSDTEYTNAVNNGTYGDNKFINDGAGYGLAQWTHSSRKKPLLELARSRNKKIDDFNTQIEHLYNELVDFGTFNLLKNYTTVKEANDKMIYFLAPNVEKYPNLVNQRLGYAKGYYDLYKNSSTTSSTTNPNKDTSAYWNNNSNTTSTSNTNNNNTIFGTLAGTYKSYSNNFGGIGGSNDEVSVTPFYSNYNKFNTSTSNFKRSISSILNAGSDTGTNTSINSVLDYLKKIADGIMSIVDNTDTTNTKLEDIKKIESEKTEAKPNVSVIENPSNKSNSPMFDIANNRRINRSNKEYQTAKLIASGG